MILFGSSLQYDAANIEIATINLFQGGTYLPIIILKRFFLNFLFCLTVGILLQPNQKPSAANFFCMMGHMINSNSSGEMLHFLSWM